LHCLVLLSFSSAIRPYLLHPYLGQALDFIIIPALNLPFPLKPLLYLPILPFFFLYLSLSLPSPRANPNSSVSNSLRGNDTLGVAQYTSVSLQSKNREMYAVLAHRLFLPLEFFCGGKINYPCWLSFPRPAASSICSTCRTISSNSWIFERMQR
jgi:hypothetical protein